MSDKQITISKEIHKNLKAYCANTEQKIKEFTEAVVEQAMLEQLTAEQIKEKQYRDSFASTSDGGPMIRYSGVRKEEEPIKETIEEETVPQKVIATTEEDNW